MEPSPNNHHIFRISVLVSGGGTNLQALIEAQDTYRIVSVIADRDCYALQRAKNHNIPVHLFPIPHGIGKDEARISISNAILETAQKDKADAIVLSGFLTILKGNVIQEYSGRIINLHPALLPKFGGHGMWGHHVHEAVLHAGEKESGCTVHLVDAGCDTGEILLQKKVPVREGDTAESLAKRISTEEHTAIVEGVRLLAKKHA